MPLDASPHGSTVQQSTPDREASDRAWCECRHDAVQPPNAASPRIGDRQRPSRLGAARSRSWSERCR
ncbi:hypothetical protein PybrP1_004780 [[Pythium] brassicae (nom. inval.)]|nr:hypothetical protein PybrP1_004780 [[Pythium] brassicae (nom. inval.)]